MKKYILIVLSAYTSCMYADQRQETFLQAAQAYQDGNYEKALYLYDGLPNKSGIIWYNVGNCYFRTGQTTQAIACWLQAVYDVPRTWRQAAWHNSAYAQNVPISNLEQLKQEVAWLPLGLLQLLCVLSLLSLAICIFLRVRTRLCAGATVLVFVTVAMANVGYGERWRQHVVVQHKTALRAGPAHDYAPLDMLEVGMVADVIALDGQWCKLRGALGDGWVASSQVSRIIKQI